MKNDLGFLFFKYEITLVLEGSIADTSWSAILEKYSINLFDIASEHIGLLFYLSITIFDLFFFFILLLIISHVFLTLPSHFVNSDLK